MATRFIEPEVEEALNYIENKENFILTGGAGSGKTYSLISLIELLGMRTPNRKIVCITYTNNAVAEIRSRISNDNLSVLTIHEFLWNSIKKYQDEIIDTMIELINSKADEYKIFYKPRGMEEDLGREYFQGKIIYDEYYNLKPELESSISHDHVLILAERMFDKYRKLCDILIDTAEYIFIDEYQDTSPYFIEILLTHLQKREKKNTVGFFGDSMQAIYDDGIGKIEDGSVKRIKKEKNRRNPKNIIELANKFRDDDLIQEPSEDLSAPNMNNGEVIDGNIKFIYGDALENIEDLLENKYFSQWDFTNSQDTKILNLVHRANAGESGFERMFHLYNSDEIYNLIKKIIRKIERKKLNIKDCESFHSVTEKLEITIGKGRERKLLLDVIQSDNLLSDFYESLKEQTWGKIKNYRIPDDSLISYKYNGLIDSYESKGNRDAILTYLDKIYEVIELYRNKNYNLFLKKSRIIISNFKDKKKLNKDMEFLDELEQLSIEAIIKIGSSILSLPTDNLNNYIENRGKYHWERLKNIPFGEYIKSIEYLREELPYATQHSVKGSEFKNVLIILDNGNWTKYNFEYIFQNGKTQTVTDRTRYLFYVCVTRAMENLVLFMPTTDPDIIRNVESYFGEENTLSIEELLEKSSL